MPIKERILKELQQSPKKFKQLKMKFKGSKKFFAAMDELYENGIIEEKNGFIRLVHQEKPKQEVKDPNLLQGTVVKLTENFGFVRIPDMERDLFVAGKLMMGAVVGDEVEIKKIPSARRDFEGEIVAITKEKKGLVGSVEKRNGRTFVALRDCPSLVPEVENKTEAKAEDVVLVDLFGRGRGHRSLTAKITMVIGRISDSKKAVELLLAEKGVAQAFDAAVINEATLTISRIDMETERAHRTDLTDLAIFTIDSASTKDIDDAVYAEKTENGYRLGVHIADVSHFVRPASLCNKAAFERGTSIYYGESVIPMLPVEYSNDVCSLNENSERLAFTCDMFLDKSGNVTEYKFYKSIIRSKVKGVYTEINSILDNTADSGIKKKYSHVEKEIFTLKEIYTLLDAKRNARGSMDIESDEAYIIFNESGKAVDIKKRERGLSEQIIEECMLLANSCSANLAKKAGLPFVYRVHEQPDVEKLQILKNNLRRFGLKLENKPGETMQQAMSALLDKTRDTNLQQIVHTGVLRSQAKAKYSENPIGHFGLALEDYAHFTSPIRRYPDLAIHRILTDLVNGVPREKIRTKYEKFAKAASSQASAAELVAMQVERDAADIYKAELMQSHIGETFSGIVTSVTSFGIYVTLENTVEGLAHVSTLNMVSPIFTEGYSLDCPISGISYKMGQSVTVQLLSTDILNGNIDFTVITEKGSQHKAKTAPKPKIAVKYQENTKDKAKKYDKKPYADKKTASNYGGKKSEYKPKNTKK